jgi:hypothetical protein
VAAEDQRFGHPVVERIQNPVDPKIVEALYAKIPTSAAPTTPTA